jgi:hypothetical protein
VLISGPGSLPRFVKANAMLSSAVSGAYGPWYRGFC